MINSMPKAQWKQWTSTTPKLSTFTIIANNMGRQMEEKGYEHNLWKA